MWVATCETPPHEVPGKSVCWQLSVKTYSGRRGNAALHEASFVVMDWMLHIAQTEGRMPNIIGLHSIAGCGQGQVSVWLELDDPNANEGMGIIACHVDASAIAGMDRGDILAGLMGQGGTVH